MPEGGEPITFDSTMTRLSGMLARLRDREEGQTLAEYALILVLVAMACLAGLTLLGGSVSSVFNSAANAL
jgi:Flp pilus assembly pilin Flp